MSETNPGSSPDAIQPVATPDQAEVVDVITKAEQEQLALEVGSPLVEKTIPFPDFVDEPATVTEPTKSAQQIAMENETSWMIKDAGEQKPSEAVVQGQTSEAWDLYEGNKAKEQLAETKAADADADLEIQEHIKESMTDELTGLPNRKAMNEAFTKLGIEGIEGFAFVDLDKFKPLNDTMGHDAGDKALQQVADKLRAHVSELAKLQGLDESTDVAEVARMGGDEFAILYKKGLNPENIKAAQQMLKEDVKTISFDQGTNHWEAGASIGYASSNTFHDATEAIQQADTAMYVDKGSKRREGPAPTPEQE